jgi:hypothetical protein
MGFLKKAIQILAYNIKPEHLRTLWYEDVDGNDLGEPNYETLEEPTGAKYQVSRFPSQLTETWLQLIDQADVDTCLHPEEHIRKTYGWVDGVEGRECVLCHGTQVKDIDEPWPDDWEGYGSREAMVGHMGWPEDLALAIANSGDFSLGESIIISATACERCTNAMAHDYGLEWGYKEFSEEWEKSGTICEFCDPEGLKEILDEDFDDVTAQFRSQEMIDFFELGMNRNDATALLAQVPMRGSYRITDSQILFDNPRDAQAVYDFFQLNM